MKKMPPAGLAETDRERPAAAALGVELHALAQLLQVGEGLFLVAPVHLEHRKDARDRGARGARVGHLQACLVGRVEQVVPRRRRAQLVLGEELAAGHEHQRIVGDRGPLSVGLLEPGRQHGGGRRLVGLEHVLLDAGREGFDRSAEQHVDPRVVLLRDDAGERLARGEAQEVHLDAARRLELLQHRPRPVLRPDRIDVQRLLRARRTGRRCQDRRQAGQRCEAARQDLDTAHDILPTAARLSLDVLVGSKGTRPTMMRRCGRGAKLDFRLTISQFGRLTAMRGGAGVNHMFADTPQDG